MDDGRQSENGRHYLDYFRGTPNPWNMVSLPHQMKEPNALVMNKKIMSIIAERDAAIRDRNVVLSEKMKALVERDEALRQRNEALSQRDSALIERDNAVAAFQIRDRAPNKHLSHASNHATYMNERQISDAFPIPAVASDAPKTQHQKRRKDKLEKTPRKKVGEDLNRQAASVQDVGLNLLGFDESTMQTPICSCTGVCRQCYKWGNGGWQSSCCTIHMSMYPLPHMPSKRHARMGGRKMSGSVFARLLSRLAGEGRDPSLPVDLKDYWARHGTNRYITIR